MFDHESKKIPISLVARDPYREIAEQIARVAQQQGNRVSYRLSQTQASRHKSVDSLRGYVRDAELFKDHAGAGLL
jgi:vacuolar-type H+-ATPase subunit B/Vma2